MSFGDGFANGLEYGSRVMQRGMDNYKERELEETQGKLFDAALSGKAKQLDEEGKVIEQKSQERENVMGMFSNASVGDIFQATMDNYTANGGKINNDTYKLAMGVASTLFGMKEKEVEFQRENAMFGLKKEKLQADISRTRQLMNRTSSMGSTGRGGQPASRDTGAYNEDGTLNLKKVRIGSSLFKSMPQDVRRAVLFSQGVEGKPSPRAKSDIDMTAIEEETPAPTANTTTLEPKTRADTESKKPSWKDYL